LAPNATDAPDEKPVPTIVTADPPVIGPADGVRLVTAGGGVKANVSAGLGALAAPPIDTVTSTLPELAGLVAVRLVAPLIDTDDAGEFPK